jgi:16S rRNA (cytosine1402-N4)-methyltransferase
MSNEFHHVSVLLEECIEGLAIKPDGIYVDGTLGGAGHSSRIAAELTTGRHIGIDRDPVALKAAGKRLEPWADRVTLVHSNFCEIAQVLEDLGIEGVDGIVLDWATDGAYWALYEGEEYATESAAGIVLTDGSVYKLVYEKF